MEALQLRIKRRAQQFVTLALLTFGTNSLFSDPEVLNGYFNEDGVVVDGMMTGGKNTLSFIFIVEYNTDVHFSKIDANDIVVEGTSGAAAGQFIPVNLESVFVPQTGPVAQYELGPFDASANGTYEIKIVEGEVTAFSGSPPPAVPAGTLFTFEQDIGDPTPELLKIYPLEIYGEPVAAEGEPQVIEGPYGHVPVTLRINLNNETDFTSIRTGDIEVVGLSGDAAGKIMPSLFFNYDNSQPDKLPVEFVLGRLDSTANGEYSIRLVEGAIEAIGNVDPPATLPGGEILRFTQNITDPPPAVVTEGEFGFTPTYFQDVALTQPEFTIYYNLSVNPESLDGNDITITGISPENINEVLTLEPFVFPTVRNDPINPGYVQVAYSLAFDSPLQEALNGDWKVEIVEGEVEDMQNPPTTVPAGLVGTFNSYVVDPFQYLVEGRVYEEKPGTTPSLEDDGWETDPGLMFGTGALLESPPNGGVGFQEISFSNVDMIRKDLPIQLSFEITGAMIMGESSDAAFIVSGDGQSFFQAGDKFVVSGSPVEGNNGTFTVRSALFDWDQNLTTVYTEEPVVGTEAGGTITKEGPFTTEVFIDGASIPLSFTPADIPTIGDLMDKINTILDGKGLIFEKGNFSLQIESCTYGASSTVEIVEPTGGMGLFTNIGGSPGFSQAGSEEWQFLGNNRYIPPDNFEDEDDYGRLRFEITEPGAYRIRLEFGAVQTKNEAGEIVWVNVPPPPQLAIQAVGDPFREGEPQDHTMYFFVKRTQSGEAKTINFSYKEEMDPPHLMHDEIQVQAGSKGTRLNVLANDGSPAGNNEDLTIIGLSTWLDGTLLQEDPPPPTELTTGSQGYNNPIWTDGEFVYYDSPGFFYELFYYIVEDSQGRRDFEAIYIDPVFEVTNQFAANDDFATMPVTASRVRINVLANDTVEGGGSKDQLRITSITPNPTANGGMIVYQGTDVFYTRPSDFLGTDTFTYTMTDDFSGTDTATVSVSVNELPHSNQREALLNLFLQMFGSSQGGGAIYAFFKNHISEINYIILDQEAESVAPKANGKLPLSRLHVGGTAETQARLNALLDLAEPAFVAVVTGQGDSGTISQELVDALMTEITYVQERASPDLKADLQALCEMTNDFQDLVGKTFNESASILGLEPDKISIPNLAIERISNALSITTYDVVGVAYKLWKSRNLQPESWEEVQNAEVETTGQRIKISDPDIGDEDAFYQLTSGVK